jgi:hypothetical protein
MNPLLFPWQRKCLWNGQWGNKTKKLKRLKKNFGRMMIGSAIYDRHGKSDLKYARLSFLTLYHNLSLSPPPHSLFSLFHFAEIKPTSKQQQNSQNQICVSILIRWLLKNMFHNFTICQFAQKNELFNKILFASNLN